MSDLANIQVRSAKYFYNAVVTKSIMDENTILYVEFFAMNGNTEKIVKVLKQKKIKPEGLQFDYINASKAKIMNVKKQVIEKRRSAAVAYDKEIFGRNPKYFIGRSNDEVFAGFKSWLSNCQSLPYPRGFKEELECDAEKWIYEAMLDESILVPLKTTGGMLGYKICNTYTDMDARMMKIIHNCVKAAGMLEVDRFKKIFQNSAPEIGESSPDTAKVFATIENKEDEKIYFIIEYDKASQEVFCLVKNKKTNTTAWEQILFDDLFDNTETFVNKSEEYADITIDAKGNVSSANSVLSA